MSLDASRVLEEANDVHIPRTEFSVVYSRVKIVMEWVGALLLLITFLPLIVLLALLVKVTSRGPAFYRQQRLGRGGSIYQIIKLRSMYHNCEAATGAVWSLPGDRRITPIGRWLRDTHLDELPQLFNVLGGSMCLIGPRPERPELVPELEKLHPRYRHRLQVKPGMTGLAQMRLPADTELSGVRLKLAHDLYYCEHLSLMLDVRILLSTAMYFLSEVTHILSRVALKRHGERVEQIIRDSGPLPDVAAFNTHRPTSSVQVAKIMQNMSVGSDFSTNVDVEAVRGSMRVDEDDRQLAGV